MDIARIKKLAGLKEGPQSGRANDYDYGHRVQGAQGQTPYRAAPDYHYKGRADAKQRVVNNQADNPMPNGEGNDKLEGGLDGHAAVDESVDVADEVDEEAQSGRAEDYDFGHRDLGMDGTTPYRVAPDYHYKGRGDEKARAINNQGDTPMPNGEGNDKLEGGLDGHAAVDESIIDEADDDDDMSEFTMQDLDSLHDALRHTGISDKEIFDGIELSERGYRVLANKFGRAGYTPELAKRFVGGMLIALQNKMGYEAQGKEDNTMRKLGYKRVGEEVEIDERSPESDRFSMVRDYLGNVTIADAMTGKTKYLQGSEATNLLRDLEHSHLAHTDDQAAIEPAMEEGVCEDCGGDGGRYDEVYEWQACANCTGDGMHQNKMLDEGGSEEFEFTGTVQRQNPISGESDEVPVIITAQYNQGDMPKSYGFLGRRVDYEPQGASCEIISARTEHGEAVELTPEEQTDFQETGLNQHEAGF